MYFQKKKYFDSDMRKIATEINLDTLNKKEIKSPGYEDIQMYSKDVMIMSLDTAFCFGKTPGKVVKLL